MKNLMTNLKTSHPWQKLWLLVILGLAIHFLIPQITSIEKSWQTLVTLTPWAVGASFLAQVFSYLGSGYILQSLLRVAQTQVKLGYSTLIVLGSASVGMVAGGMVGSSAAIYRWSSQKNGHPEDTLLASVLPSLFNNLLLVCISLFGLIHLILVHNLSKTQLIGFTVTILFLGMIIGAVTLALYHRGRTSEMITGIESRWARIRRKPFDATSSQEFTQNLYAAWDTLRNGAWHRPAIGALLNTGFDMLTLWFLFIATGHEVSPGILLTGYGLPLLLGKVAFILPGGVGVIESSMAALYSGLGIPNEITVVVVLGYRLISFWIPSIAGFPIAAYLQRFGK